MRQVRVVTMTLIALSVAGQDPTFRTTVPVVLAPVTVTHRDGKYVDGLDRQDFALLDDGRQQVIQVDTTDTGSISLSVVILVQANNTAPAAVRKIQKIGSMIEPLITGERGHAAVIAFGGELTLVQDFTSDPEQLIQAFRHIQTQPGAAAHMLDGVAEAARLFERRPANERRVLFIIAESRDRGSRVKLEAAVRSMQLDGVAVYPIVFSAYVTPFTTKASDLPPSEGGGLLMAVTELARLAKSDSTRALAEYSGGRKTYFATLRGLEKIVSSLGEELHSQYILSYTPQQCRPGFHRIEVRLASQPGAIVRSRYGYFTDDESCRSTPR